MHLNMHLQLDSSAFFYSFALRAMSPNIQGASGIDACFLKLSPASAISPIMTKFSQYTPHSTCYLVLVFICWQD